MSINIEFDRHAQQCMTRCNELAMHTETRGQLTRRYLTPAIRDAYALVSLWMREAGLVVRVDAAGNLIGTRESPQSTAKTLIVGSHLDTVPNAGKYDGMLGVVAAITVVQALGSTELPFAIDVIGFSEEEGVRFAAPYLGSQAIAGTFDPRWLDLIDDQGDSMRGVIEAFGLNPDQIPASAYPPESVIGFVEAHIEQGPVLARSDLAVGVVNAIAGQSRMKMLFRGQPGHAGTTPMFPRADALVAASRFIVAVSEHGRAVDGLRATVGYIRAEPNARNVIPGEVEVSLDVRHADDQVRKSSVDELCKLAKQFAESDGVEFVITHRQDQPASRMDPFLSERLQRVIGHMGIEPFSLLSGAGHDAVAMSDTFPTAMLFIRQPMGISHHPDEDVELSDVAVAIEVLTRFVCELAGEAQSSLFNRIGQRPSNIPL